jgi:hypothetical protein
MTRIIILILFVISYSFSFAQVTYINRPQTLQVYPRNIATNTATITVSGVVAPSIYIEIKLDAYRNGSLLQTQTKSLSTSIADSFLFSQTIVSELADYKFVVSLFSSTAGSWIENYTADRIAAGDAIIIQGQSNAEGSMKSGSSSAYNNDFIRVYGYGTASWFQPFIQWYIGQGDGYADTQGNTGQWGLVLANALVTSTQRPIVIFNGGNAGKPVSYFLKNNAAPNDLSNSYGRMLTRVQEAGFQNHIRAIFWYQGEANAINIEIDDINSYKVKFNTLKNAWANDFPGFEKLYISQIRYGCGQYTDKTLLIKEALRQIAIENTNARIYGTGALQQFSDDCHYSFSQGYEKLGLDWSYAVKKDLYGAASLPNTESPFVTGVVRSGASQLQLILKNTSDNITIQPSALNDFYFEGSSVQPAIISATVAGNTINLHLSEFPAGTTGLTYAETHIHANSPNILNANNMAMVNFYNMPIYGVLPIALTNWKGEWAAAGKIKLKWEVDDETTTKQYVVQFSSDDISYYDETILSAKNNSGKQSYELKVNGRNGANYFRLKILTLTGEVIYSDVIVLREKDKNQYSIFAYPNPIKKGKKIFITGLKNASVDIKLINATGQQFLLHKHNLISNNQVSINLNTHLSAGLYSIIAIQDGIYQTVKIYITN